MGTSLKLATHEEAPTTSGLFSAGCVGFDAGFGNDSKFRDAEDSLGVNYFGDIKSNSLVWLCRPKVGIPIYSGKGCPPKKERVLESEQPLVHVSDVANNSECEWEPTILAEGAQGPIILVVR